MTARRIEVRRNQKSLFKKDLLIYQGKFNNNESSNSIFRIKDTDERLYKDAFKKNSKYFQQRYFVSQFQKFASEKDNMQGKVCETKPKLSQKLILGNDLKRSSLIKKSNFVRCS